MNEPPLDKNDLRQELTKALDRLSDPERARASVQIAERVLALPEVQRAQGILSCLSFGVEVDTWNIIERLQQQGKRVYVPRAEPRDKSLHVHAFPCPLRTLSFGLQQPPRGTPEIDRHAIEARVDVALVLGLGFDRAGYRLGYGTGYFDRFLADCRPTTIALAYDRQLVDRLPREAHDIPLDLVVTDQTTLRVAAVGENVGEPR